MQRQGLLHPRSCCPDLHCHLQAGVPSTGTQPSGRRPLPSFQVSDIHGLCQSPSRFLVSVPVLKLLSSLDMCKRAECSLADLGGVRVFKLNCYSSSDCGTSITSDRSQEPRRGLQTPSCAGTYLPTNAPCGRFRH